MDKQGEKKVKKLSKKTIVKWLVIIFVLAGLAVGAFFGWQFIKDKLTMPEPPKKKNACSKELIDRASVAIDAGDFKTYSKDAIELIEKDNYQDSVDCSYIVAQYYLRNGRQEEAKKEVDRIESLINSGQKYSKEFASEPRPVKDMRSEIKELDENANNKEDRIYISDDLLDTENLNEIDKAAPSEE
ncbi:hypothetical protein CR969_02315 [Candidatus Saccharibacteria bacterium]|nr:MAG: hypothetical protein CR969_02315 [Candidatus Saccharibacteria bacterium]